VPIRIISFEVTRSQIGLGDCVRFNWVVEGQPTAIFFDGEGVGTPDSRDRCPTSTKEFVLRAMLNDTVADRATLTVVVIQPSPSPSDTQGPTITSIGTSDEAVAWPDAFCTYDPFPNQVTISAVVTDDSGVDAVKLTYRVVRGTATGSWQALAMNHQGRGLYRVTLGPVDLSRSMSQPAGAEQNGELQYYIQAFDELGNRTDSKTNTLTIVYCYIVR
jgi:hypothetical protein